MSRNKKIPLYNFINDKKFIEQLFSEHILRKIELYLRNILSILYMCAILCTNTIFTHKSRVLKKRKTTNFITLKSQIKHFLAKLNLNLLMLMILYVVSLSERLADLNKLNTINVIINQK